MIDRNWIGKTFPALTVDVEKGQLKFFAKSVDEKNPVYTDVDAAKAAGYRGLPAPPTFSFSLNMARSDPFAKYVAMGIDLNRMLHAGQNFEYLAPICAGDTVTLETRVKNIYEKKGGTLEFVEEETMVVNQLDEVVARFQVTLVVKNQG